MIGDDEYRTEATLPAFASAHLIKDYRAVYVLDQENARDNMVGVNVLDQADVAVISAQGAGSCAKGQLDVLRKFVLDGKPVIGLRTASHAFAPKANAKVPSGRDALARIRRRGPRRQLLQPPQKKGRRSR